MNKKAPIWIIGLLVLVGVTGWQLGARLWQPTREDLVKARDKAIVRAVESGQYRCCIEPPCTMCFWEANEWNNYQAGTCACDDLIAAGKEPCPQCHKGGCGEADGICKTENEQ